MESAEILVSGGVAAMLAGVAGGGLKAFGVEVPLLATVKRQLLTVAAGVALIGVGLVSGSGLLNPAAAPTAAPTDTARVEDAGPSETAPGKATPGVSFESQGSSETPSAPDMLQMGFPQARRLIIAAGWS